MRVEGKWKWARKEGGVGPLEPERKQSKHEAQGTSTSKCGVHSSGGGVSLVLLFSKWRRQRDHANSQRSFSKHVGRESTDTMTSRQGHQPLVSFSRYMARRFSIFTASNSQEGISI